MSTKLGVKMQVNKFVNNTNKLAEKCGNRYLDVTKEITKISNSWAGDAASAILDRLNNEVLADLIKARNSLINAAGMMQTEGQSINNNWVEKET